MVTASPLRFAGDWRQNALVTASRHACEGLPHASLICEKTLASFQQAAVTQLSAQLSE
jgi:hypothetical protein